MTSESTINGWVFLELLGHRRLAGHLSEATVGGAPFLRIDIPGADDEQPTMTQYYAPNSVYAITPTTEAMARRAAALLRPAPVSRWEMATLPVPGRGELTDDEGPF
jgi:hypothetical protein